MFGRACEREDERAWSTKPVFPILGLAAVALTAVTGMAATHAFPREPGPAVRSFEIVASRFKFEPALIEVTEGDEVNLVLRSADSLHGLEIKELKVKVRIPRGGAPVSTSFVASRAGTFEVACSEYCGMGHRNMKARLVVTPRSLR